MNYREFAVLDAVNIATTRYRRPGHDFEATARQIAIVLNTDPRIRDDYTVQHTVAEVGATLRALSQGWPRRREPLVEKIDSRRWHLTDAGVRVLGA